MLLLWTTLVCVFFRRFDTKAVEVFLPVPVVEKVDSTIRWKNLYLVDKAIIGFPNTYLMFQQPGPEVSTTLNKNDVKETLQKLMLECRTRRLEMISGYTGVNVVLFKIFNVIHRRQREILF